MDRSGYTRAEGKQLRALAALAWERELGAERARLEEAFRAWRAGAMSPHELSDSIHQFHQGPARDLYSLYTRIHASHLVGRAVAAGVLASTEVGSELLAKLDPTITCYGTEWPPGVEEHDGPTR